MLYWNLLIGTEGKPQKTPVRIASVLTEISTEYLPNTSPKHYYYAILNSTEVKVPKKGVWAETEFGGSIWPITKDANM